MSTHADVSKECGASANITYRLGERVITLSELIPLSEPMYDDIVHYLHRCIPLFEGYCDKTTLLDFVHIATRIAFHADTPVKLRRGCKLVCSKAMGLLEVGEVFIEA